MHSVLILWAPDTAENRKLVDAISRAFEDEKKPVMSKRVTEANVADITAAEIIVFGAQASAGSDFPPEFSECLRIFRGITLAGRTAGLFSMGTERATSRLRRALKDTEIALRDEDPLFADQKPGTPSEIAEWARRLVEAHQELKNARA